LPSRLTATVGQGFFVSFFIKKKGKRNKRNSGVPVNVGKTRLTKRRWAGASAEQWAAINFQNPLPLIMKKRMARKLLPAILYI
jgi:hypothetical protein